MILDVLYFYCENPESLIRKKDKAMKFHIEKMYMMDKMQVKRLFRYFDHFPFKDSYFDQYNV